MQLYLVIYYCLCLRYHHIYHAEYLLNLGLTLGTSAQSSTDYNSTSQEAIDGNLEPDFYAHSSCTHTTSEESPWWMIDLGVPTMIYAVSLVNRADCCGERNDN